LLSLNYDATDLFSLGCSIEAGPSRGLSGDRSWSFDRTLESAPISVDDLVNKLLVNGLAYHYALVPGGWNAEVSELGGVAAAWKGDQEGGKSRDAPGHDGRSQHESRDPAAGEWCMCTCSPTQRLFLSVRPLMAMKPTVAPVRTACSRRAQ
jgi:hypothetical protein